MSGLDLPRRGIVTHLGRWCRDHRVAYHDLASRAGISRRQMVRYVVGDRRPTADHAEALIRVTGLTFEALRSGVTLVEALPAGVCGSRGAMDGTGRKGVMR